MNKVLVELFWKLNESTHVHVGHLLKLYQQNTRLVMVEALRHQVELGAVVTMEASEDWTGAVLLR